jgi:hypothetical protein
MRITLDIDDEILDEARRIAQESHKPFNRVVNEALCAGLRTVETPANPRPYRTRPHKMGLRAGLNLDNIQELLTQVEGEN